ncbi:MAG: IS21-like element helper ATPase IstB [Bacilli bacterium]|jgi:DNA replication protein DnaC|nr:IS21-like element helper ATPase IstB [Defluviitoga sp.]
MNEIQKLAKRLRLPYIKNNYQEAINESLDKQFSYEQFLKYILIKENEARDRNGIDRRIKAARFPYLKYLTDLDYNVFPLEVANRIRELQSLSFIDQGRNIILVGNPGVGKTHTAIGLGIKACMERKSVLFITVPNLITELKENMTLNQLTNYKKKFINYDLVILDELGYISFDKQGSELLFNLLSMRSEQKSIIITTNLAFSRWQEIFHDPALTAAMVDRLTYKAYVINITGDSYRLRVTKEWLNR